MHVLPACQAWCVNAVSECNDTCHTYDKHIAVPDPLYGAVMI